MALAQAGPQKDASPDTAALMIFSRENVPLETMQKQYSEQLTAALTPLRQCDGADRRSDLRQRSAEAAHLAALNLRNFELNVQLGIRLGLGLFVAIMLGISLIMMSIRITGLCAGTKLARRHSVEPACLAVCLIVLLLGHAAGPIDIANPTLPARHAPLALENQDRLDKQLARRRRSGKRRLANAGRRFCHELTATEAPEQQRDGQRRVEAETKKAENGSTADCPGTARSIGEVVCRS